MGKKRVASAYLFGQQYDTLKNTEVCEELADQSQFPFPLSPTAVDDNSKLMPKEVYMKILEGSFMLAPPERTKTSRKSVSKC